MRRKELFPGPAACKSNAVPSFGLLECSHNPLAARRTTAGRRRCRNSGEEEWANKSPTQSCRYGNKRGRGHCASDAGAWCTDHLKKHISRLVASSYRQKKLQDSTSKIHQGAQLILLPGLPTPAVHKCRHPITTTTRQSLHAVAPDYQAQHPARTNSQSKTFFSLVVRCFPAKRPRSRDNAVSAVARRLCSCDWCTACRLESEANGLIYRFDAGGCLVTPSTRSLDSATRVFIVSGSWCDR